MSADLAAEIRAVLRRYARTMADGDGDPPRGLVGELVRIAQRHAASVIAEHPGLIVVTEVPPGESVTVARQIRKNPQIVNPELAGDVDPAFVNDARQAPDLDPDKRGLDQSPGAARPRARRRPTSTEVPE